MNSSLVFHFLNIILKCLFKKKKQNMFPCFRVQKMQKTVQRTILLLFSTHAAAKSLQSCLTRCDPMDGSPPGSLVPRILQARTLEWVAISFSNA